MASSSKSNTSLADCSISNNESGSQNKTKKSYKAGKLTRNPFFNFLREFRAKNSGKSIIEIARQGGAAWRALDGKAKEPYKQQAAGAPKTVRKSKRGRSGSCSSRRGGKRSKHHRSSRRHSSEGSRGRSKSKSSKSKRHRSSGSCGSKGKSKSKSSKSKRHRSRSSSNGSRGKSKCKSSKSKHHSSHKRRKHHKKSSGSGCGKRSKSKTSNHSGGYSSHQSMYY